VKGDFESSLSPCYLLKSPFIPLKIQGGGKCENLKIKGGSAEENLKIKEERNLSPLLARGTRGIAFSLRDKGGKRDFEDNFRVDFYLRQRFNFR